MLTWKYTLPAFVVPFVFTLRREGMGVLMQGPVIDIVTASATAAAGVAALAAGLGGWIRSPVPVVERVALAAGGLLLLYASAWSDIAGFVISAVVLILHFTRQPRRQR